MTTNAFDANVPKRKPRTRLSGILAEAEAQSQVRDGQRRGAGAEAPPAPQPAQAPALESALDSHARPESPTLADLPEAIHEVLRARREAVPSDEALRVRRDALHSEEMLRARRELVQSEEPFRGRRELASHAAAAPHGRRMMEGPAEDVLRSGQERVAELRTRFERATLSGTRSIEPAAAAGRIRDTVTALRTQLQRTTQERAELLEAVRDTRRDFLQAQRELESLRADRDQSRALALQHRDVAEELLTESESLAAERDAALARIQEFRSLDSEQSTLLDQMGNRLSEREALLADRDRELAETREALFAVEGESELIQLRLDELQAENRRLHDRVALLESELGTAANAREALIEIQRLVESLPSS